MDSNKTLAHQLHGLFVEVVMSSLTLFCMGLDFLFPQKKKPKVMTQQDIANIVFKERKDVKP